MKLPELPRVLSKKEANITPRINAWMALNAPACCAWEIKVVKGNTCPKNAVLPHQLAALKAVMGSGITYKISDEARRQVPFDAFKMSFARAFVVVYYQKHKTCKVYLASEWSGASASSPSVFTFVL